MGQELRDLKRVLKTRSQAQIAVDLGYRSSTTVFIWLRNKKIPTQALERVRKYLETRGYDKHNARR